MDAPLWNENPFTLPNSNSSYIHQLNIRCTTFGLAIFITNDTIAFRDYNKIQLFSISQNKIVHELRHGENIRSFFQVNNEIIISFGYYNMYLWEMSTGRRICKIKFNERSIPVNGDEGSTFTLCRNSGIDSIQMKSSPDSNKVISKILRSESYKSTPNNFISIRWASRFGNKILISKDDGIILFHVSNQSRKFKVINRQKFLVDERLHYKDLTTMNDKYFVHPDGRRIIVRSIETFQVLRTSMDFADIPFHDNEMDRTFSARLSNISLYGSILLLHFYSAEKGEVGEMQCYHAFIISSIETGSIVFKYAIFTSKDTTLQKPQLDRRGIIINDGRVKIIRLPESVFEEADDMNEEEVELESMKDIYLSCIVDPNNYPHHIFNNMKANYLYRTYIEEFYWAHRILMLTISDLTSDGIVNKGEKRKEQLETIYAAANEIQLTSEEEYQILNLVFCEAENGGIIEKDAVKLNSTDFQVDNLRKNRTLCQIGTGIIRDFIKISDDGPNNKEKFSSLKISLQRYASFQRMRELVSLAFNFIPFIACSDEYITELVEIIFEKLPVDEVQVDLFSGLEINCSAGNENMETRVLNYVAQNIQRQDTEFSGYKEREQLISFLKHFGTNSETLRMVFLNGAKNKFIKLCVQVENNTAAEENDVKDNGTDKNSNGFDEKIYRKFVIRDDESISSFGTLREDVRLETYRFGSSSHPNLAQLDMEKWTIQELFDFDISKRRMKELNTQNCSILLAAYIVRYDDEQQEKLDQLKEIVHQALKAYGIDGLVLSDRDKYDSSRLSKLIAEYIQREIPEKSFNFNLYGKIISFLALF